MEIIADDEYNADSNDEDEEADDNDQSRLVHWNLNLLSNTINCYTCIDHFRTFK